MAVSCSAPVVQSRLITLIDARAGMDGVGISWSHPGNKIQREHFFFDEVQLNEVAGQLGNGTRHESYTLTSWVCVKKEGDDAQATAERAWAIVAEIEAQLKPPNNADLGIAGTQGIKSLTVQFAGANGSGFIQGEARTYEIEVSLAVEARI